MGEYLADMKMIKLTLTDPGGGGRTDQPVLLAPSAITAVYPEPESGCWLALNIAQVDGVIVQESCAEVRALLAAAAETAPE